MLSLCVSLYRAADQAPPVLSPALRLFWCAIAEVEVVVETVVETVCHADNCTSICEGQIQEAIEELQSP